MLLADGRRANSRLNSPYSRQSFDHRRELAIENVPDVDVIERLQKIADHDWEKLPYT